MPRSQAEILVTKNGKFVISVTEEEKREFLQHVRDFRPSGRSSRQFNPHKETATMFEALLERRGYVSFVDDKGKRHVTSVFSMGTPKEAGSGTTYLTFTNYRSLFVRCPLAEVKAAMKRARTLRKAQVATANRRQLEFDFNEKREASAVTPTPQITQPPEESKVVSGGS